MDWALREAGSLVGGLALLAAALLAVVVQLAVWRQRLTDRSQARDGVARRSLDEAVANTLLSAVTCVLLAGLGVIEANILIPKTGEGTVLPLPAKLITALVVGGCTYLVLTFILIVNLMFDAYVNANGLERKPAVTQHRQGKE
jgi:hypothetical protein